MKHLLFDISVFIGNLEIFVLPDRVSEFPLTCRSIIGRKI